MAHSTTILVAGATGNLGGAVARSLLGKGLDVYAGTTHPESAAVPDGAHIVKFDYEQPSTVEAALRGADGLFLVAPPLDVEAPDKLKPVIDQAGKTGVKHIVFTSALGVDQNEAAPLRAVETHLMGSGLNYTILRPNFFMENFTTGFLAPMIAQGGIYLAAGDGRTSFISVDDIAAVAATAFAKAQYGTEYNLTGPAALDHGQVAKIISEVAGKTIQYHALPEAAMLQGARDQGLSESAVGYMAMLYQVVREGWVAGTTEDVQKVLGRPPISFGEFAQKNAAVWK
jgi:uncharacterized protein YbjT (DUF2867 family)